MNVLRTVVLYKKEDTFRTLAQMYCRTLAQMCYIGHGLFMANGSVSMGKGHQPNLNLQFYSWTKVQYSDLSFQCILCLNPLKTRECGKRQESYQWVGARSWENVP